MSERPKEIRQPPTFNEGVDAALTVIAERQRHWRDKRGRLNPKNFPGQVETELLLIGKFVQERRRA